MNAVCSVASLEWIWRIYDNNPILSGQTESGEMRIETIFAKEDT